MKKNVLILIIFTISSLEGLGLVLDLAQNIQKTVANVDIISGFVLTDSAQPIADAVVSDGYSVVKTSATGHYSFPRNERTEFVFVSIPEAYEIPMGDDGAPQIYARVPETGNFTHNFVLVPFADGGAADFNHVLVAIGDPQVRRDYETWRFRNETIQDIKELQATYPEGTKFYGVVLGDLVWDAYARLEEHKASVAQLGFPVFNVIGNHDHDLNKCGDIESDHFFKASFGPTYYSFNRGNIHYVMIDNIDYIGCNTKNYTHNITQNQIDWLIKDLEHVPIEKTIVLSVHAPMQGSNVANRQIVFNLMAGRPNIQHILAGHHHRKSNIEINARLFEHIVGTANGAQWSGDYCSDGAPNGYEVLEAGDRGFNRWYYKATGKSRDYQLNAYPAGSFPASNSKGDHIIANVWNYDSKWSVNIYENGVKKVMQQFTGVDPRMYDFLAQSGDTRPNYPGSDGGTTASQNPGYSFTSHLFSYKPENPDADFVVEVTDRFGQVYTQKVLRNIMAASFVEEEEDTFVYRQDFNSLPHYPNHLLTDRTAKGTFVQGHSPIGWYATTSGNSIPTSGGNWEQFNYYRINNGDQNVGWLYSYGAGNSTVPNEHSTERAMGSLVSSSHRNIHFGVVLENNTGKTLSGLEIEYNGEMWRVGSDASSRQALTFSYALNPDAKALRERTMWIAQVPTTQIDSLSFVSPENNRAVQLGLKDTALDGNNAANRSRIKGKIDLQIYPGEVVLLRWEDIDDPGNDHGLAIDNLVIKPIIESNTSQKRDITLTETYAEVVQTSSSPQERIWPGDHFDWTVTYIRRAVSDTFPDGTQAGWFRSLGYVHSTETIEGGMKNLTINWGQFGSETGRTLRMMLLIDGIVIDSIIRNGNLGKSTTKHIYSNNAVNMKKNVTFRLNNTSYSTATGEIIPATTNGGRFLLGNITWTPYIWYLTKSANILKGAKFTNTDMIDNLDADMNPPTYTSSNTSVASVDPTTGEVTGLNEGTSIITARTGEISTTYKLTVDVLSNINNSKSDNFSIFPTNISDVLHIKTSEKNFTVKVYNQLGCFIAAHRNSNSISFNNLAAGMYIIRIQSENNMNSIHKVFKNQQH